MKLVRQDDHSVAIIGTLEKLYGMAAIAEVRRESDGSLDIDYAGGTEIYWDEQRTVLNSKGGRIFIDENFENVDEDQVDLVEEIDDQEEHEED